MKSSCFWKGDFKGENVHPECSHVEAWKGKWVGSTLSTRIGTNTLVKETRAGLSGEPHGRRADPVKLDTSQQEHRPEGGHIPRPMERGSPNRKGSGRRARRQDELKLVNHSGHQVTALRAQSVLHTCICMRLNITATQ